ncbi:MAG: hypothetical protein HQL03_09970 [Nitrospirae bacterium]|nr:hypothetical protein [Nitrospirota bacterium]MBF0592040.1 hypothetical protein [Nitrospirota bacterium]
MSVPVKDYSLLYDRLRPIAMILALSLSLLCQNTCLYGLAGKTVITAMYNSHCKHCPMRELPSTQKKVGDVDKIPSIQGNSFLLTVARANTIINRFPLTCKAFIPEQDKVDDVFPEPSLRPPIL